MTTEAVSSNQSPHQPAGNTIAVDQTHRGSKKNKLSSMWPEIWALIYPRRWIMLGGLLILVVNKVAALALPASTKFLIDDVIVKHHGYLLLPLIGIVLGSTFIQAGTS